MNKARYRLVALAVGVCLMGLLIGLMTLNSHRQTEELRERLQLMFSESFHIADRFRNSLRELNTSLYQYGGSRDTESLEQFRQASEDLDRWIDAQKPKLVTAEEKALMQQIDTAYDDYRNASVKLIKKLQGMIQPGASLDDYSEVRVQSQNLFELGDKLAEAHSASQASVVAHINQTINQMRVSVFVSLALLFGFGLALVAVVYRDMIAPLRKKLVESEMVIERAEKLASLGMLAAGVAHEIRNPLTAIKAALFIQQKKFKAGTQEFADSKLVEREILRLERIVNDFLQFARPTEPVLARIPVAATLQEVASLLLPQMSKLGVQLVTEPVPDLFVKADAAQIKQVLINLIQNAADAVGPNGLIKLRARASQKRLESKDLRVVILEVVDNGKGMPPEVQKRLFDPFFTTKDNGTGLGLSIAAGIIHKHRGALEYQSQVEHGTTFGIILPQVTE